MNSELSYDGRKIAITCEHYSNKRTLGLNFCRHIIAKKIHNDILGETDRLYYPSCIMCRFYEKRGMI